MACKAGIRENIEAAKQYYARERELEKTCPYRALWRSLHGRVYSEGGGFGALTQSEQKYWALNVLEGEVYNGGFDQYFYNSSGSLYRLAVEALVEIGAGDSLSLLVQAKEILFGGRDVPEDAVARGQLLLALWPEPPDRLEPLDKAYWKNPDQLGKKIEQYAITHGLVAAQPSVAPDGLASAASPLQPGRG